MTNALRKTTAPDKRPESDENAAVERIAREAMLAGPDDTAPLQDDARRRDETWSAEGDPIGQHLRRAYRGVASEPIPERLQELLDTLRKKENE